MAPRGPRLPRTILIVEDNEDTRALLREHFLQAGYTVQVATDGNEAVATALRVRPDIIVLDLAMPALDGVDTLAVLRSYPTTMATPVVVYTANIHMLTRRALRYEALVEKPCAPHDLERIIDGVLDGVPESDTA